PVHEARSGRIGQRRAKLGAWLCPEYQLDGACSAESARGGGDSDAANFTVELGGSETGPSLLPAEGSELEVAIPGPVGHHVDELGHQRRQPLTFRSEPDALNGAVDRPPAHLGHRGASQGTG